VKVNHSFEKLGGAAWFWAAWGVCNADGCDDALVAGDDKESAVRCANSRGDRICCGRAFTDRVVCTAPRYATPNVSGMHDIRIVTAVSWPALRRQ
jgi:hypothetical protein